MSLEYKGYSSGPIDFDDGVLSGTVAGLRDVVHFQGGTAAELEQAFRDSIDCYLDFCAKRGEEPESPTAGGVHERPADLRREDTAR